MGDEYGSIRRKFEELEEEVRKLREPLETTLMDVRELISNLENPFNYATNIVSIEELRRQREESEKDLEQLVEGTEQNRCESELFQKRRSSILLPEDAGGKSLATITCAYLLLKLFGREHAVTFLSSSAARNFAPPQVLESLLDAIKLLLSIEGFNISKVKAKRLDEESTIAAAYLLNLLSSGADEKFFLILVLLLKILDQRFGKRLEGV